MEIKIELDLPAIVAQAVSAERIQPIVDKAIAEAVKDAINDATGYRSKFRDAMKEQLSEAMPHGLRIDDVAKFQQVLNAAVSSAVQGENAKAVQTAISTAVGTFMPDLPSSIKLSELLQRARSGFHKESHEAFFAELEMSEFSSGGGWLSLDDDESRRYAHSASMRLGFGDDGHVFSLRLDDKLVTPLSMPNAVGEFDAILLALYVGRTTLEIDMDEHDVKSAASEQYD
ncbi:hypothetical protein DR66_2359 [Delftia acidovorans]|uniref:hypothetical protein n=1 Tax=Delftia acidovorans TaxID=80866 RepID=UPI0005041CC7|nr:hypothetical protein [Delftia acidovorans]KFJ09119.1 hypothetical protein DR66_2359 [Delftia acidovorans]QQB52554.1 hypothetical protein I6H54_09970 [Delftia acidovorans]